VLEAGFNPNLRKARGSIVYPLPLTNGQTKPKLQTLAQYLHSAPMKLNAKFHHIIRNLMLFPDSWPFNHPVNVQQVPRYLEFIKEPMDFSTMAKRIDANYYVTQSSAEFSVADSAALFKRDLQMVFDNCRTFNPSESDYCKCAGTTEKEARRLLKIFEVG